MAKEKVVEIAPFEPYYWQKAPLMDKSDVMLLAGSAGGGKSRLAAEKVVAFALHYAGATVVIARKKRDDMDQSTIPLVRDTVLDCENNPIATWRAREDRIVIDHGEGKMNSEILFIGIFDERARQGLRSIGQAGAVDIAWMEEAIEFEEDDFDALSSRVRGTAAPWTQILISTNPGPTLHWINRRMINGGEASCYFSSADDNPANPESYKKRLARMTGIQGARMRDGLWVDGVGLVVDTWLNKYNPRTGEGAGNVTLEADYVPGAGKVVWYMDDGYAGEIDEKTGWFTAKSNPRVCLMAQITQDDRINIFHESYEVEMLADKHLHKLLDICDVKGYPYPEYVVHDSSSPSLGGQIKRAKLKAVPVRTKTIEESLIELRQWIGEDRNGRRAVHVHPRCKNLLLEMSSYTNDATGNPIDAFNHGPDALRYGVWWHAHGEIGRVTVAAPGVNVQAIEERVTALFARLEEKYANVG